MAEAGWINRPIVGKNEVQENVFSGAFRYREHRPNELFHPWFDGKPPEEKQENSP